MKSIDSSLLIDLLSQQGLLLQQDRVLPSVVTLVAGERLAGSWWSHPRADGILQVLSDLTSHPDVLLTKLVACKVTFVHKHLWPAVLAVAEAREPWQLRGLSAEARQLYEQVEERGEVICCGPSAKEVERRLLARGEQFHSGAGQHMMRLESWRTWKERSQPVDVLSADAGRTRLEAAVRGIGGSGQELPWVTRNR